MSKLDGRWSIARRFWVAPLVVLGLISATVFLCAMLDVRAFGVLSISPTSGPDVGGTEVTISGYHLLLSTEPEEFSPQVGCAVQVYTAPITGEYLLELWGASGGGMYSPDRSSSAGGAGGFSRGSVRLEVGDELYINVGGQGKTYYDTGAATSLPGGCNGGGAASAKSGLIYRGGGGGASDVRVNSNDLNARVAVAGGGGGGGGAWTGSINASAPGGVGGGTSGAAGGNTSDGRIGGGAGTQIAGGAGGHFFDNTGTIPGDPDGTAWPGVFGVGGDAGVRSNNSFLSGGGGGGWYGGGGAGGGGPGGGGGSGWVYTASTFGAWNTGNSSDAAGFLLNPDFYLDHSRTQGGAESFLSPAGVSETGHVGDGFVRITPPTVAASGDPVDFSYNGTTGADGTVQTFITPGTGSYLLEVWGAEGGSNNTVGTGGRGGYSQGIIELSMGETLYINVGGKGLTGVGANALGGWNGGGQSGAYSGGHAYGSGGGATDIRVGSNDLKSRAIVAGGGGGSGSNNGAATTQNAGGAGGGSVGLPGITSSGYIGGGGTQSSGGTVGSQSTTDLVNGPGRFGLGGSMMVTSTGGGGGGGWYGGGAGSWEGGGGGSGWIYDASTFTGWSTNSPTDAAGWLLDASQYLTDAETLAGDQTFDSPIGASGVGHVGHGYARITPINVASAQMPQVTIGGNDCPVHSLTLDEIKCMTAPHAAGLVDVTVAIGNESHTLSNAYEYIDTIPPLSVTNFSPSSGSVTGGYQLTITGDGFNSLVGTPIVTIGGIAIPSSDVTVDSLTQLTVIVPNFLSGGQKTITVELADNSATVAASGTFEATYGITSITPNVGFAVGGATVIINGSGFCAPNGVGGCLVPSVMFGTEPATNVTILSDSQISVVAPPNDLGVVDVVVTNGSGIIMTEVDGYTYDELAVTGVDPSSGSYRGGTVISVTGTGFGDPGLVTPVEYDTCGAPEIFEAPASGIYLLEAWGAQGGSESTYAYGGLGGYSTGKVELEVGDELYLYVGCQGGGTGAMGGHVGGWNGGGSTTGSGSGGGGATDVRVNGSAITDRILVAGGGGGSSSGSYGAFGGGLVGGNSSRRGTATGGTQSAPGVTSPSNSSYSYWTPAGFGYGGDIIGGDRTGGGGGGGGWFGGAAGPNDYPSYNDNDDTPGAGGSGYIFTAASDLAGYGGSVPDIKYHLVDAQTISGDSTLNVPDIGSGVLTEGRTGSGAIRISALGVDRNVKLGTSGSGYANCTVISWTNNEIVCKTTAHDPGVVDITVSIGGEAVTLESGFTYEVPAPVASSLYPTAGPVGGGVVIKIEGSNFVGNAAVAVGGVACIKTLIAEQVIYCVVPAGTAGTAPVSVTTQGGSVNAGSFTYNDPMVVTDITPAEGPTAGGTDVTITGENFVAANKWAIDADFSGNGTAFAIDAQGRLYSWGYNGNGNTGTDSSNYEVRTPTLVNGNGDMPLNTKIVSVASTSDTAYAIDIDGNLYAWGHNSSGAFGNCENGYNSYVPVKLNGVCPGSEITTSTKIVVVDASYQAAFAIDTSGKMYSWGYNWQGQLGNGVADYSYSPAPTQVLGDHQFVQVSVGNNHVLAVDITGDLYAWGSNNYGQLGNPGAPMCSSGPCLSVPTQLNILGSSGVFNSVAAGNIVSLVSDSDGNLFTFGGNENGQLGLGLDVTYDSCYNSTFCKSAPVKINGATDGSIPNAITGSTKIMSVVTGDSASAAIDDTGYIYTWGSDNNGQIGNGPTEYVHSCYWDSNCVAAPIQLTSFGADNLRLLGSQSNFMVIRPNGVLYAWGYNSYNTIASYWRVDVPTVVQMFAPSVFMVRFGLANASLVTVVDSTTITAKSPRHDAGVVDVSVVNSDVVETLEDAYTYIAPAINSIVPNFGPVEGGTEVTISGHGFGNSILPIATGFSRNITSVLDSSGYPIFFIVENDGTLTRVTGEPESCIYETIDTTAVDGHIMRLEGWWGLTDAGDAFLLPATAMALDAPVATEVDAIFDVTLPAGEDPTNSSMLYASRWDTGEIVMVVYDVGSQTVVDTDVAAIFDGLPDCEIKGGLLLLYCDDNTVWFAGDGSDAMQIDATAVTAPIVEIGIIEQGIFGPSFVLDAEGGLYYLDTGTIAFLPVDTSMADGGIVGVDTSGTVFWDAGGNLYILDSTNSLFMINDQIGTELHTVVVFMVHNTPAILGAVDMDGNVIAVAVDTSSGESELIPYGQIIIPEPVAPVDSPVVFDVGGVPAYCEIASWSNTQIVCTTASHVAGLVTVDVKNGRYNSAHMSAEYIDSEGSLVSASNVGSGFLYQDVYIELVVSDAEINLALSPAVSHSYESTTLTVETNADNGYKLSYYVDGATAALICSEDAGRTIGPGSGSLADNTWGYAIGASPTTWSMPSTSNTQIDSYSSATEGRDTIFNAAGRITPLTPACDSYKAELVFTAEANL